MFPFEMQVQRDFRIIGFRANFIRTFELFFYLCRSPSVFFSQRFRVYRILFVFLKGIDSFLIKKEAQKFYDKNVKKAKIYFKMEDFSLNRLDFCDIILHFCDNEFVLQVHDQEFVVIIDVFLGFCVICLKKFKNSQVYQ